MKELFDSLRDLTTVSVIVRMVLATICGGFIGLEREYKRRPAGFRTHILICLGASMATLTSQYLLLYLNMYTDLARLGAQVVAGIGFIGAGCIIVTRSRRVKGLTTAAGLWVSAIVGLSFGAGYFEGGLFTTLLVMLVEILFSRFEKALLRRIPEVNIYVEYERKDVLEKVMHTVKAMDLTLNDLEFSKSEEGSSGTGVILQLNLNRGCTVEELTDALQCIPGVLAVEEI